MISKRKPLLFAFVLVLFVFALIGQVQAQNYLNLTLDRAVSVAMENNRDLSKAKEDIVKSSLQITEAASAAYPTLSAFWDFEKVLKPMVFIIEFPDPTTGLIKKNRLTAGTDHSMGLGASLNQNLYIGGKVGTALKAAKIYRNISEKTYQTVEQNIIAGVVQAFNGALLTKEIFRINQESLAQAERNLKNVQTMFDAGSATEFDLLRARVQAANIKPGLLSAENQVVSAKLTLKETLGVPPDAPLTLTGTFAEPDTSIFKLASLETALENRPDLMASEYSVDLYEKNIKIARGDLLPTITAGSMFQYMGNFDNFKYNANDWIPYWTARVNLSIPIFSGFKNTSRYKQAKIDFHKAKTDYNKTYDSVYIEVQEGIMNLRNAVKTIESQRMNIEQAERALKMAESLYTNGKATQLEVLDAQLALEHSKTNMVNALYTGIVAEINLKKYLGILDADLKI
ncbi:MAG: TolC family protein [Candidatus Latescibacteria bacterium]|nr:TolC family protein [Candidatus Latescibacterota bacterium]